MHRRLTVAHLHLITRDGAEIILHLHLNVIVPQRERNLKEERPCVRACACTLQLPGVLHHPVDHQTYQLRQLISELADYRDARPVGYRVLRRLRDTDRRDVLAGLPQRGEGIGPDATLTVLYRDGQLIDPRAQRHGSVETQTLRGGGVQIQGDLTAIDAQRRASHILARLRETHQLDAANQLQGRACRKVWHRGLDAVRRDYRDARHLTADGELRCDACLLQRIIAREGEGVGAVPRQVSRDAPCAAGALLIAHAGHWLHLAKLHGLRQALGRGHGEAGGCQRKHCLILLHG